MNWKGFFSGAGAGLADAAGNPTLVNLQNQKIQRQRALQDDFTKSQYDLGTAQIPAIQNDPSLSPEEKASRINTIRQQGFKIMNVGMAKAELAKAMQRFGITDTSGPQSVPAEQPLTLSAQPQPQNQQVPFTPQEIAEGGGAVSAPSPEAMKVQPEAMSGVESLTPAPVTLPGREAQHVAQAPTPINSALAGTTAQNPYAVYHQQLIAAGLTPQDADKAIRVKAGLEAPQKQFAPHSGQWETIYGTKDGVPYAYRFSKALGQSVDLDNNPIDSGDLADFIPSPKAQALKESIVPDKESPTGYSKIAYDPASGTVKSKQMNIVPPRGLIDTLTISKDQFGNEVVTTRSPQLPGHGNVPPVATSAPPAAPSAMPPPSAPPQGAPPAQSKPFAPPQLGRHKPQAQAPAQPQAQSPTLDEQGHIPMRPRDEPTGS
jgi:hypothetical protein